MNVELGTIELYMLKSVNDRCIFLTDQNLCSIYESRPKQCRNAPYNFFSKVDIWKSLPCIDIDYLRQCDSSAVDEEIVAELLVGYALDSKKY